MRRRRLTILAACATGIALGGAPAAAASGSPSWSTAASRGIQELIGSGDGSPVGWDSHTGLWGGSSAPHWWQSGLAVLTLVRYAHRTRDVTPSVHNVLIRTYQLNRSGAGPNQQSNFTDRFLDDTGWWALAWLAAARYELLDRHDQLDASHFLLMAESDAAYIARQPRACGGIVWGTGYGPDTITDAEFVALAAELARFRQASGPFRNPKLASQWLADARRTWAWLKGSGLIDVSTGEVAKDSLTPGSCQLRGGPVTYTQGEVAEALVQLGLALHDSSYYVPAGAFLRYAADPANGFILRGILQDHCEPESPNCSALAIRLDVTAFKGILVQAFDDWTRVTRSREWVGFLRAQATAIAAHDILGATARSPGCRSARTCQFGFSWARPLSPMLVTVGTQESALDAFTAVLP
jgi:hypothetical protein